MVNAVSFGKRDNENNPTGGKWIGAGAGVAYAGYNTYKGNKLRKEIDEFMSSDAGKKVSDCKDIEALKKFFSESTLSVKTKKAYNNVFKSIQWTKLDKQPGFMEKFVEELKHPKKPNKLLTGIYFGVLALIGLGLGAIVDHFRKKDEED